MRTKLAVCVLAFSANAFAVDLTITLTAPQATRVATACGKQRNLHDAQGQPRACTLAEVKQTLIERLRTMVTDQERLDAAETQQRNAAAFDPS